MALEQSSNQDGKSILDQIIDNNQTEQVARLDAVEITEALFAYLNEREQDVLRRRFGLQGTEKETLENIGSAHKLTRERIRQIETTGVKKLRQLQDIETHISRLRRVINQLMEEHGGIMEKQYLLDNLVNFSAGGFSAKNEEILKHKNHLEFLISRLLHDHFEEVNNSKHFREAFKLKFQILDHLEELATELVAKIKEAKQLFKTEEIIEEIKQLASYKANQSKFDLHYNLDISNILKSDHFLEKSDLVNQNKAIYAVLRASKHVQQNKFGNWGLADWREVKPKTINDKIYLILKNEGKPLHFVDIADQINKISFDGKPANAATVHNELILDDKYVLVGRGLYSLKEWGYKRGTVADVIKEILSQSGQGLTRDQIIDRVLAQRVVKKATIILALMDKNIFRREGEKYFVNS
ncbi:MAG: sigma factor-like helix-turn-helix DNA-binding protein [Candidatus Falkowbacteria bacterium]